MTKLLEVIAELQIKYPHLRLGQLLYNVMNSSQSTSTADQYIERDLFYVEDQELYEACRRLLYAI